MHGIKLSNVTYHYADRPMFINIDLHIPSQNITCLIGPNGSGKSTLLKLMAGLLTTKNGSIVLDKIPLERYTQKSRAKKMAYLPQQCLLPPSLTVREYIALGRFCHQTWFSKLNHKDRISISEVITLTNLDVLADLPIATLSVGQQQRARIALMLAQEAEYLLLDEPMSGLDLKQQRNMLDLLCHLHQSHGKTIVVILHDLQQVMEVASNVVLLKNNTILGEGHPREIINPAYILNAFDYDCEISKHNDGLPYIIPKKLSFLANQQIDCQILNRDF